MNTGELLVGTGLSAHFDDTVVFDGLDVAVGPGAVTGVVGRSGSGKTTLLRILAGLTAPAGGTVEWRGDRRRPGDVGLLAQHPRLVTNPRWTLRRIVAEPATIAGRTCDTESVATRVGLDSSLLDRYPAQVSDGQLQRACIGRLVVQGPRIVLCDEPTAMLDPMATRSVTALLDDLVADGAGLLLVSHDRRLVESRSRDVIDLDLR
ncbi:ABC transporter ATP-binding protein [Gordonia sp. SCSIO 19800]|uniref:ABC transporter ATP-binding protein n=1 Tax=Gordonia sp. SCSIO 19800 TaxID=2826926 RepID=UPI001B813A75|nr:ATP-binding cassette domain-containing protein [Gordonia sp. SCSIO 19800]MBR7193168.1 ATP-binding cassette domain-containing protein [Gordonia sp. SCSIO 19800]